MKKTRKAHLWIGLICSIFILMESITGLIMNEPWLIGQSQTEQRGNFQPGMMTGPGQQRGTDVNPGALSGETRGQSTGQSQSNNQANSTGQAQGQTSPNSSGQFPGFDGPREFGRESRSQGSFMSIIRGLHEGRLGTINIKWLIDLTAIAMIFLTASGIYLSLKVLRAGKKRKKAAGDSLPI
ncbi:PepSY-associated TM helix domain-containing protein [Neobacillus sp. 19]|uniref:PepSY-associated TM helix domain-containing protein n=1 Tax=Neobacillus sp. 19 TaxID=3394458 RepID=UPI003BF63F61